MEAIPHISSAEGREVPYTEVVFEPEEEANERHYLLMALQSPRNMLAWHDGDMPDHESSLLIKGHFTPEHLMRIISLQRHLNKPWVRPERIIANEKYL